MRLDSRDFLYNEMIWRREDVEYEVEDICLQQKFSASQLFNHFQTPIRSKTRSSLLPKTTINTDSQNIDLNMCKLTHYECFCGQHFNILRRFKRPEQAGWGDNMLIAQQGYPRWKEEDKEPLYGWHSRDCPHYSKLRLVE